MALDDVIDEGLRELGAAASAVADDQRQVARRSAQMRREHAKGRSWTSILDHERSPGLVDLMRRSTRTVAHTTASLTRLLAAQLSEEGNSRRQIARLLGVSHQRVTAIVSGRSEGDRTD